MDVERRRRRRERGIALATSGLAIAVGMGAVLGLTGAVELSLARWTTAAVATLLVQGTLFAVARRGWDARLGFDPHFIIVPTLTFGLLLDLYVFLAPQARHLALMGWFVALLFLAGHAGLRLVLVLSGAMSLGFILALCLTPWRPPEVNLARTVALAAVFWAINFYAGLIFERLKHDRREMHSLRRQLAELALTDPLTGLPNRRRFAEALAVERARVARYGGRFCLAMIDVDHFKAFNDAHGHPAGDALLREMGGLLRSALRDGDVIARYGGEEFALLLVSAGHAEAEAIVERLRVTVEGTDFAVREGHPGRVTISAGLAEWPRDGADECALVAAADAALYRAKAEGRNRVRVA